MVVSNVNTILSPTFPKPISKPQFVVVDGHAAHGDCADCGEVVFVGDSFIQAKGGEYVCQPCADGRCVKCAGPDAMVPNEGGEPICLDCLIAKQQIADELFTDAQFAFYAEVR